MARTQSRTSRAYRRGDGCGESWNRLGAFGSETVSWPAPGERP
jgi:hypothetical protein